MTPPDHDDGAAGGAAAGVRAAEEARRQAMLAGDVLRLDELLADALVYTHATGVKDSKPSYLQQLASGALRYEALEFIAPEVTLLGRAALVCAVMKATIVRGDSRRQAVGSYLAVWENTPAGWKLQAVQATALPVAA